MKSVKTSKKITQPIEPSAMPAKETTIEVKPARRASKPAVSHRHSKAAAPVAAAAASIAKAGKQEVTREEIAQLAYSYWEERNRSHGHAAHGSPEEDWRRAERSLAVAN